MHRLALLALPLLLAGCAAPDASQGEGSVIEFEHDLSDGAPGSGVFGIREGSGAWIVELWFAPSDPTADRCLAAEPASLRLLAPGNALHEALRLEPQGPTECPERKSEPQALAPGDWTFEAAGRGPIVARVRIAQA